jgi:hypothetical protein
MILSEDICWYWKMLEKMPFVFTISLHIWQGLDVQLIFYLAHFCVN